MTRDPAHERARPYRPGHYTYQLEPLTPREFATLQWLAERGYDGGLLDLAGVEEELPNGDILLGALRESEAWEFHENVEEDPHAFLTSSGAAGLNQKMWQLLDSIV